MSTKLAALTVLVLAATVAPSLSAAPPVAAAPAGRPTPTPTSAPSARLVTGPIAAGQSDGPAFRDVDVPQLGKVGADKLRAHAIRPANVVGVESDKGPEGLTVSEVIRPKVVLAPTAPKVNLDTLSERLHASLSGTTYGYAMQIRKNGQPAVTRIWKKARGASDGNAAWNLDTRMHIASVSKFITAVAMVKMLDAKGISVDAKIAPYLLASWVKGTNVDKITFRQLLRHTSGFRTDSSASDFATMKWWTMIGVGNNNGTKDYENMNFGLCRILLSTVGGLPNNLAFNDATYDYVTIETFRKYVQDNVFTPSNVVGVSFAPVPFKTDALAYSSASDSSGWNSGDLASMAGGAAFRLSINELLDFMGTFRRKGTIVSVNRAQEILDQGLGLDVVDDTPAGRIYDKNGRWRNSGNTEQSLAMFLPNEMELAIFVNSPIGAGEGANLRSTVRAAYDASIK